MNIASRMDYTGERGAIHLPQATARQLMNEDPDTGKPLPRDEYNSNLLDQIVICTKVKEKLQKIQDQTSHYKSKMIDTYIDA